MSTLRSKSFSWQLSIGLPLLVAMLCGCTDGGGGYSSGSYSSDYYDWYHHGGYYYNDIYVPNYPDRNPDNLPDRGDRPRPEHPIVKPDRPSTRPSIPNRARPMNSSVSRGISRGGMRGGGMRGGRGGRR